MSFCELHARSAFSFLRGGSNPELLAEACARARIPAMRFAIGMESTALPVFTERPGNGG